MPMVLLSGMLLGAHGCWLTGIVVMSCRQLHEAQRRLHDVQLTNEDASQQLQSAVARAGEAEAAASEATARANASAASAEKASSKATHLDSLLSDAKERVVQLEADLQEARTTAADACRCVGRSCYVLKALPYVNPDKVVA